ncbi:MAG: ABC transporter substrate-binding protein [Pseudomonadota bacterium]
MIARLLAVAASAAFIAQSAWSDARTEAFVEKNGGLVLEALNDPDLDQAARTEKFAGYMRDFSDLNRIARFVVGRYARGFTEEEFDRYAVVFEDYMLTSYEIQFDAYRGEEIVVNGSKDRDGRRLDSIVNTTIRRNGEPLEVEWRVQEGRQGELQIIDVALNLDGNKIWLAIESRAQLTSFLGRNNGSADALIERLKELTAELEASRETNDEA